MKFFWLSFISAVFILIYFLTACDGLIVDGECSDVEPTLHQTLGSVQKESGHFSKGDLYHYKHSYGFNFDLKVTKDTLFWQDIIDICHFGDEQIRSVKLESTYPIVSVNMTFHDDYLYIKYKDSQFFSYYDSIGFELHHYYDYRAKATLNDIYATLSMQSDFYGGRIGISCEEKDYDGIEFINRWKDTLFNDGYSLSFEDSLKVNGKMYKDVIVFDGTEGKGDRCIFDKLYFAAKFGLLKIDLLDTISIIRQ